jgi:F-type H+-transporting ATPase subunit b
MVDMKKKLLFIFAMFPVILFANEHVQTDIIPRTVNFLIFVGIVYYLLSDKLRFYFSDRTKSIQHRLDEVQIKLEESKKRVEDAKAELENAKKLANNLVKEAIADVPSIKTKVAKSYENELAHLSKAFNDKTDLEAKKMKKEVVSEVLNELLNDDNIAITNETLTNIILKKVA